ncbi:MAG: transcription elongation factor subunit Spt4 [Candidatus Anstonellales archaeon]
MKACRNCKFISKNADKCPLCNSDDLTDKFSGIVVIIDIEKSKIAKLLNIKTPGEYAILLK